MAYCADVGFSTHGRSGPDFRKSSPQGVLKVKCSILPCFFKMGGENTCVGISYDHLDSLKCVNVFL